VRFTPAQSFLSMVVLDDNDNDNVVGDNGVVSLLDDDDDSDDVDDSDDFAAPIPPHSDPRVESLAFKALTQAASPNQQPQPQPHLDDDDDVVVNLVSPEPLPAEANIKQISSSQPSSVSPQARWYKPSSARNGTPPPPPAPRVIPPSPPPSTTKQKQPQQNLSPAKASAKATKAVAVASTSSKRKTPSDDDMCAAIRANDALYERILLLEAPHMSEFEVTIKEAGLAIPRTALVAFLERQGVPVANTGNRNRATPTKRRRRR